MLLVIMFNPRMDVFGGDDVIINLVKVVYYQYLTVALCND